jgi:hypothetical protein
MSADRLNLRRRVAVAAVFFTNGAILASWVPHIPAVKGAHGLDDAELGVILLCMAAGAAFSLAMAVGRLSGDVLARRFGDVLVLRASALLAAAGLGAALIIGAPLAGIAGCGAVGLGIANIFPILLSQAGRLRGVEPSLALAAVTATGYFGFLAGAPLIGIAAEWTNLPLALGIVVAFCVLIAVLPAIGRERRLSRGLVEGVSG